MQNLLLTSRDGLNQGQSTNVCRFNSSKCILNAALSPSPEPLTPTQIKGYLRFASVLSRLAPALAEPAGPEIQAATGGSLVFDIR